MLEACFPTFMALYPVCEQSQNLQESASIITTHSCSTLAGTVKQWNCKDKTRPSGLTQVFLYELLHLISERQLIT